MAASTTRSWDEDAPKTATELYFFPKLPTEIRIKVWKEASFISTAVLLSIRPSNNDYHIGSYSKAPPILHTNQESRQEATKHYVCAFEREPTVCHTPNPFLPAKVYVNFGVDYLVLDDDKRIKWNLVGDILGKYPIKKLAITSDTIDHPLATYYQDLKWDNVEQVIKLKDIKDPTHFLENLDLERLESTPLIRGNYTKFRYVNYGVGFAWSVFWKGELSTPILPISTLEGFDCWFYFKGCRIDYGSFEILKKISYGPITGEDIQCCTHPCDFRDPRQDKHIHCL